MGRSKEESRSDCRHLPPLRDSRRGIALGIYHSPRLAFRASACNLFYLTQIGPSQYQVNGPASPRRINSSLTMVSPTLTSASVLR
jgi:hypothetical protein